MMQVFFTVVLFGLFHGLAYLPVVLSWIGPNPYQSSNPHGVKGNEKSHSSEQNGSAKYEMQETQLNQVCNLSNENLTFSELFVS